MTKPARSAYSRLETDVEILQRVRVKFGNERNRSTDETYDAFAERHGMQRKIIWEDG